MINLHRNRTPAHVTFSYLQPRRYIFWLLTYDGIIGSSLQNRNFLLKVFLAQVAESWQLSCAKRPILRWHRKESTKWNKWSHQAEIISWACNCEFKLQKCQKPKCTIDGLGQIKIFWVTNNHVNDAYIQVNDEH